jgi:preprotein translocase subunit SecF
VFDRIRENLIKSRGEFAEIVNQSFNQTFARSINTSVTVLLVLVAVYFFGGETLKNFALTLILGISIGTYSSIFVASTLLVVWHNYSKRSL